MVAVAGWLFSGCRCGAAVGYTWPMQQAAVSVWARACTPWVRAELHLPDERCNADAALRTR